LLVRADDTFRALTTHGYPQSLAERLRQGFQPGVNHPIRQLVDDDSFAHVPDLVEIEDPTAQSVVQLAGVRTSLFVPLRRDGSLIGVITAGRVKVRPFSEKQIALLQNFAAQAVIAMENARLLTETREALEQQTATAEILQVINSSPGDLTPVFDAILEKAHTLCGADYGSLLTYDGERFWPIAWHGAAARLAEAMREGIRPWAGGGMDKIVRGEEPFAHIQDMAELAKVVPDDALARTLVEIGGIRTTLVVPLRKDNALLGVITANRQEVRPFSEKQIALLQNFAAQAVIAIENTRLITETREALEQQTATAEVLQVINSSPGDLTPVFDAILEKAHTLCAVAHGALELYDGETFRAVATRGLPESFAERVRKGYRGVENPISQQLLRSTVCPHP
jgi:GAF domain-containing protein